MCSVLLTEGQVKIEKPCKTFDEGGPHTYNSVLLEGASYVLLIFLFVPITWVDQSGRINEWVGYACVR